MVFTHLVVTAQPAINIESIKSGYSKYNAVITRQEVNYVFDIVKDSLQVTLNHDKEVLILNDHSKAYTNDYIFYDSFCTVGNIEAYTLIPRGNKYEKIPVTLFNEKHERDGQVFFDDSKTVSFAYPSITEGALTYLGYSIVFHNPRFLNRSYFQSFMPVISSKVVAKVHKNITIGYRLYNDGAIVIHHKEYSRGNYNYFEWEADEVMPYRYLNSGYFNVLHYTPHIALFIDEVKKEEGIEKYYSTVDELYRFDYEFISGMSDNESDELKHLVEEITRGLSDREKAKAIYYWVQDNIKYIAYSDGYHGFIPRPASEVFSKRFGDCKGMTSLIKKMMDMAGLPTYFSWVGTRSIPYTYEEMPLPITDNHMVASYMKGDSTFILDGTFQNIDFGMYPYHIQGKEVLIGIDSVNYKIFKVPVSSSSISSVYDSVSIYLSGASIKGKGKRVHTGFNKTELASAMNGIKVTDYPKRFSTLFAKGNNKFRVDSSQVVNLFGHDKPAVVFYDFMLDDYVKVMDDEIYINLNLNKSLQENKIDTTGQFSPIVNDFCYSEKYVTRFEIPDGYEISYMPEGDTIRSDELEISFKYYRADRYVILEKEMVFNFLILSGNKIMEWNSIIDRLNRDYRQSLVLRKRNT
jgi:hypothetical protein